MVTTPGSTSTTTIASTNGSSVTMVPSNPPTLDNSEVDPDFVMENIIPEMDAELSIATRFNDQERYKHLYIRCRQLVFSTSKKLKKCKGDNVVLQSTVDRYAQREKDMQVASAADIAAGLKPSFEAAYGSRNENSKKLEEGIKLMLDAIGSVNQGVTGLTESMKNNMNTFIYHANQNRLILDNNGLKGPQASTGMNIPEILHKSHSATSLLEGFGFVEGALPVDMPMVMRMFANQYLKPPTKCEVPGEAKGHSLTSGQMDLGSSSSCPYPSLPSPCAPAPLFPPPSYVHPTPPVNISSGPGLGGPPATLGGHHQGGSWSNCPTPVTVGHFNAAPGRPTPPDNLSAGPGMGGPHATVDGQHGGVAWPNGPPPIGHFAIAPVLATTPVSLSAGPGLGGPSATGDGVLRGGSLSNGPPPVGHFPAATVVNGGHHGQGGGDRSSGLLIHPVHSEAGFEYPSGNEVVEIPRGQWSNDGSAESRRSREEKYHLDQHYKERGQTFNQNVGEFPGSVDNGFHDGGHGYWLRNRDSDERRVQSSGQLGGNRDRDRSYSGHKTDQRGGDRRGHPGEERGHDQYRESREGLARGRRGEQGFGNNNKRQNM